jgi:hypothetical protein
MRPSPIQLKHVIYTKVSVTPRAAETEASGQAVGFAFDGVGIRAKVGMARKGGQEKDPRDFLVNLEIEIDNKEGKAAPYDIGVGVVGVFDVLPSLPKEKREDLVAVNGASILYGIIREVVLSLTSRFAGGALTLPGMNFEDDAPSRHPVQSTSPAAATRKIPKSAGKFRRKKHASHS